MSSKSRVLYVDGDRGRAEAVRESLETANCSVVTAAGAEAGRKRLAGADSAGFDCVVSAMDPSEADSVEFLRSVRAVDPSVPFVLYPHAGSDPVAAEALPIGATEYVPRTDGPGHEPLLEAVRDTVEQGSTSPGSQARQDAGSENASEPSAATAPEDAVEHSSTSPPSQAQEDAAETPHAQRFEPLFEHLPTPVLYGEIRPDGPIVERVNPAFEETFGYDADELVGENLDELIVPTDRQDGAADINQRLLDGERVHTEVRRLTPEGVRDFRLDVVGRTSTVEGYAIYTDVTESKRRQRRLERQNERLEKFVSVVSHDLRNPLSVARGNIELANEEYDDARLADAAGAIDRTNALVEDLLTLAREGEHVTAVEPIELGAVAEDCWDGVGTESATLAADTAPEIEADRSRIRQLLANLLRNAVEHGSTSPPSQAQEDAVEHGSTSPGSHAHQDAGSENASEPSVANTSEDAVEHDSTSSRPEADDAVEHGSTGPGSQAREDANEFGSANSASPARGGADEDDPLDVTVTVGALADGFHVSDDGPGIPDGDRDRVFESGWTTAREGTGLGLSIVAEIVEAHGWAIRATESTDGGARFEVTGVEFADG